MRTIYRCPVCLSPDHMTIEVVVSCTFHQKASGGLEVIPEGKPIWDEYSTVTCGHCNYDGQARAFEEDGK